MKVHGDFLGPPRSADKTTDNQIKKEGKDQESIQSSTTTDPGYQWKSKEREGSPYLASNDRNAFFTSEKPKLSCMVVSKCM